MSMAQCKYCEQETRLTTFEYDSRKVKVCSSCKKWLMKKMRSKKHWKL